MINFATSTDKKLCFSYGEEYFVYFVGMNFTILHWNLRYFSAIVKSYVPEISLEELNSLFALYKRLEIHLKHKLRKESQKLCEQIKAARKFDFRAAEKRIARIALLINN